MVTSEFQAYAEEIETIGEDDESQIALQLTDQPEYNPTPSAPNRTLNIGIGALVGLLLGVALAVARDLLDRTVRTRTTSPR